MLPGQLTTFLLHTNNKLTQLYKLNTNACLNTARWLNVCQLWNENLTQHKTPAFKGTVTLQYDSVQQNFPTLCTEKDSDITSLIPAVNKY